MGCNCGKPKCDGHCGISPAVLQINNPSECVLFHKVEIPASMGNEVTIPPEPGKYKNVLLYYEATGNAYFYSSDGIPTLLSYTDYLRLLNKPSINGVTLVGDKSLEELGIIAAINEAITTPTVFTMQYTTGFPDSVLPGWQGTNRMETIRETDGSPKYEIYKSVYTYYGESDEYPVTFLNEKTNEVISPTELYALLISGEDVIINHVPLGVKGFGEMVADDTMYADGVHLTRFVEPSPYNTIGFSGSAFVEVNIPIEDYSESAQCQLGFIISGNINSDVATYAQMSVQGVEMERA